MRLYLRNKATSEIREVEADSDEFRGLVKEVTPGGQPMWEQTSFPHADAVKQRAADGNLLEEDLGDEDKEDLRYKALELDLKGVGPESNPHLELTPGEIEAGLTRRDKLDQLQQMFDSNRLGRPAVFDKAADRLADERRTSEPPVSKGQLARAGGSDERAGVPQVEHKDDDDVSVTDAGSSSGGAASRTQPAKTPAGAGASGGSQSGGGDS